MFIFVVEKSSLRVDKLHTGKSSFSGEYSSLKDPGNFDDETTIESIKHIKIRNTTHFEINSTIQIGLYNVILARTNSVAVVVVVVVCVQNVFVVIIVCRDDDRRLVYTVRYMNW